MSRGTTAAANSQVPIHTSVGPLTLVRQVAGWKYLPRSFGDEDVLGELESYGLPKQVSSGSFCSCDFVLTL